MGTSWSGEQVGDDTAAILDRWASVPLLPLPAAVCPASRMPTLRRRQEVGLKVPRRSTREIAIAAIGVRDYRWGARCRQERWPRRYRKRSRRRRQFGPACQHVIAQRLGSGSPAQPPAGQSSIQPLGLASRSCTADMADDGRRDAGGPQAGAGWQWSATAAPDCQPASCHRPARTRAETRPHASMRRHEYSCASIHPPVCASTIEVPVLLPEVKCQQRPRRHQHAVSQREVNLTRS